MKLSEPELFALAAHRPLSTVEILPANDLFGRATVLKQFAQIPPDYQIRAAIEHDLEKNGPVWSPKGDVPITALLTSSDLRCDRLRQETRQPAFAIGPMLHYAPHLLSDEALRNERQRLGKSLLAFVRFSSPSGDGSTGKPSSIASFFRCLERLLTVSGYASRGKIFFEAARPIS